MATKMTATAVKKTAPVMIVGPIGSITFTCADCGVSEVVKTLSSGPKAVKEAGRMALRSFNKVPGRGWLCIDCEFKPQLAIFHEYNA